MRVASRSGRDINSGLSVPGLFYLPWQEMRFCNLKLRVSCQTCKSAQKYPHVGQEVCLLETSLPKQGQKQRAGAAAPGDPGRVRVLLGTSVSSSVNEADLIPSALCVEKLMRLLVNSLPRDS